MAKTEKNRILAYDILKGMAIFMVCVVHTGHCGYFFEYGFLYAFFFLSGATFSDKSFGKFMWGKIKRLYIPFVIANLVGYFIGKWLYHFSGYAGYGYSIKEAALRILCFHIGENNMSPAWFVLPMFLTIILFYLLYQMVKKLPKAPEILLGISFVCFLTGLFFRQSLAGIIWNRCAVIFNVSYALFFCALGFYYQKNQKFAQAVICGTYAKEVFVFAILALTEIYQHFSYQQNLRYGEISSAKLTIIVSLLGLYVMLYIAYLLEKTKVLAKAFAFLGVHSMPIMYFHVSAFSLLTFMLHLFTQWPYPQTWTFGYFSEWIAYGYMLTGVMIPALVAHGVSKLMRRRKN